MHYFAPVSQHHVIKLQSPSDCGESAKSLQALKREKIAMAAKAFAKAKEEGTIRVIDPHTLHLA